MSETTLASLQKPSVDSLELKPTDIKSEEKFNRIVVVETVYHQLHNENPIAIERRYSSHLSSDEQAYERRLKLNREWGMVHFGWVESPGLILIYNKIPLTELVPSDEEKIVQSSLVIEAWIGSKTFSGGLLPPLQIILPGEDTRFRLARDCDLWLRSPAGETRCHLHVFPE